MDSPRGCIIDPFDQEYVFNKPHRIAQTTDKKQRDELISRRDNWKWKDDDVVVATFRRSGTHLAWIMARYILKGNTEPVNDPMGQSHWYGWALQDVQDGRRVISSHSHPADFPKDFWRSMKKRKCIVVVRNNKDVAWSHYNLLKNLTNIFPDPGDWEDFIQKFCIGETVHGSWFDTVRAWEEFMDRHSDRPIMQLHFEDMVMDMPGTVRKMADFLESPVSEELAQRIAAKCDFNEMKHLPMTDAIKRLTSHSSSDNFFYRKGKVGDWKNHFTVHQNEMIDTAYKDKMVGSKLRFRYE